MFQQTTYAEYECDDFYYGHTVGTDFFVSFPMHAHSICEILFVAKGDISYVVQGKNYLISKIPSAVMWAICSNWSSVSFSFRNRSISFTGFHMGKSLP